MAAGSYPDIDLSTQSDEQLRRLWRDVWKARVGGWGNPTGTTAGTGEYSHNVAGLNSEADVASAGLLDLIERELWRRAAGRTVTTIRISSSKGLDQEAL